MLSPSLKAHDGEVQKRDVGSFSRIEVKGAIELQVSVGGSQSVEITAHNYDLEDVITKVKDGVLIIDMDDNRKVWKDVDINVEISMSSFDGIEVRGAVDGKITGLDSENIDVIIGGAADLSLSGTCGKLNVRVKGAADISGRKLKCKDAFVEVRGAGSADIYASNSVEAYLRGVGDIDIHGSPEHVKKRVSGIGSIDVKDRK